MLYLWHGLSAKQFRRLVEKIKREDKQQKHSLRLDCLQTGDVSLFNKTVIDLLSSSDRGVWNHLVINYRPNASFDSFLNQILSLELFDSIYLKCLPTGLSPPPTTHSKLIYSHLLKLTFCSVTFSQEQAAKLVRQGLINNNNRKARNGSSHLRTLEFVECKFEPDAFLELTRSFHEIDNLKTLKIWNNNLSHKMQSVLFDSIRGHRSLNRFDWMERSSEGGSSWTEQEMEDMCASFDALVSSDSCKLSFLGIARGDMEWTGILLRGMTKNSSVRWLDLSYNGMARLSSDTSSDDVFGNLWKFQNLENLDLSCTALPKLAFQSMTRKRRVLSLKHICCWESLWEGDCDDHAQMILELFQTHPRLIEFYGGRNWKQSRTGPQIQYIKDMRKVLPPQIIVGEKNNGDYARTLSLGLWPIVMERTNRIMKENSRRASVLLSLLQGPAFEVFPIHRRI